MYAAGFVMWYCESKKTHCGQVTIQPAWSQRAESRAFVMSEGGGERRIRKAVEALAHRQQ